MGAITATALAVATNVATASLPSWLRWLEPTWRAWLALGVLALLTVALAARAVIADSPPESEASAAGGSPRASQRVGRISGGNVTGAVQAHGGTVIQAPGAILHVSAGTVPSGPVSGSEGSRNGVDGPPLLDQPPSLDGALYPPYHIPETELETRHLLEERPIDWEWLLFAGVLTQRRLALREKWERQVAGLGWHQPHPEQLRPAVAWRQLLEEQMAMLQEIVTLGEILGGDVSRRAFRDVDAQAMREIANRVMTAYERILDRASRIRSLAVPPDFICARDLLAQYATLPLAGFHRWIEEACASISHFPELGLAGPIDLTLTLRPDLEDGISEELENEMDRLRLTLLENGTPTR